MKKERQRRGKLALPSTFDLDVLAAGGAVLVSLGVGAKAMFVWLFG
jgi:hypothetical protein